MEVFFFFSQAVGCLYILKSNIFSGTKDFNFDEVHQNYLFFTFIIQVLVS